MTVEALLDASGLHRHEAERLLMAVTGLTRSGLLILDSVSPEESERFEQLAERRRSGYPLQYLEREVPFAAIDVHVDERALIPRPETEHLWELASAGKEPGVVVDVCTGSGVLALSAKHRWPAARVVGTDVSREALSLARENGARLGIDVDWGEGDLFDAVDPGLRGMVDLVLANPPYVSESEYASLPDDVRRHEPRQALVADDDGLAVIGDLGAQIGQWLAPDGEVWCEIGETQGAAAVAAFSGLDVRLVQDLTGRDRYLHGVER